MQSITLSNSLVNDSAQNIVKFRNSKKYLWGVRNLDVTEKVLPSLPSTTAQTGQMETLEYSFSGMSGDVVLSLEAYDIDYSGEVQVFINDTAVGYLSTTPDSNWGSVQSITLSNSLVNDSAQNIVKFRNANKYLWGVRNLSVSSGD